MAFTDVSQTSVAFKNLLGKSNTDAVGKQLSNEAVPISFNIHASTVFTDSINSTPSVAVAAGVAVFVTADLSLDGTSNGHAFFAKWPVTPPAGTDPKTLAPFAYGAGSLTGISSGDPINNIISYQYGNAYEAKPYDNTVALIPPGDARNWLFQYQSGVFFQQDNVGNTPATIRIYVYIGKFLSDGGSGSSTLATLTDVALGSPLVDGQVLTYDSISGKWINATGGTGTGNKYNITSTDNITVPANFQYFIYGDLTIQAGGVLTNSGQVVIVNGALVNLGGTFNNLGSLILATLATGTNKKYKATFTATAFVPIVLTHSLATLDFTYQVREGNNDVTVQLTRIDTNTVQIITTASFTGTITIIGY